MSNSEQRDHAYSALLYTLLPYVVAPPGSSPSPEPRLRGVVRVDDEHARVAFSEGFATDSGVALDVRLSDLTGDGTVRNVACVISSLWEVARRLHAYRNDQTLATDSHANVIVPFTPREPISEERDTETRNELFQFLNYLTRGSGPAWFEEALNFTGFMLQSNHRCRIYIRATRTAKVHGLQIPLRRSDGGSVYGLGGALVQELFAKVRAEDLRSEPKVGQHDDYSEVVYDLNEWVDPPMPLVFPPAPPGTVFPDMGTS